MLLISALDLDQAPIIAFLEEYWRGDFDNKHGLPMLSNKAKRKGEIFQIRSLLRHRYPSQQVTLLMLWQALKSKPEWKRWAVKLQYDREEKLVKRALKKGSKEIKVDAESMEIPDRSYKLNACTNM